MCLDYMASGVLTLPLFFSPWGTGLIKQTQGLLKLWYRLHFNPWIDEKDLFLQYQGPEQNQDYCIRISILISRLFTSSIDVKTETTIYLKIETKFLLSSVQVGKKGGGVNFVSSNYGGYTTQILPGGNSYVVLSNVFSKLST